MQRLRAWSGILLVTVAGCATTPPGPPEEVAPRIAVALDEGRTDEAQDLFDASTSESGASEQIYPLLYEEANTRYQKSESAHSAAILGFMARNYPRARAVREARVYALFLERAHGDAPSPELVKELGTAVAELRKAGGETPLWIGLVEAQLAIDRGEHPAAREAFAGFKKAWDGSPEELAIYVDDIDRYLTSHP
jgi:hypothetical protein